MSAQINRCVRCKCVIVKENEPFKAWTCGHCPVQGICVIYEDLWIDVNRSEAQLINDVVCLNMAGKDNSYKEIMRPMFLHTLARITGKLMPCKELGSKVEQCFIMAAPLLVARFYQSNGGTAALLEAARFVYAKCIRDFVDAGPELFEVMLRKGRDVKEARKAMQRWSAMKPDIKLEKEKWAKRIECGMTRPDMDAISASKIHPPPKECRVVSKKRKNETFEIPDCRPALARRKK